MTAVQRIRNLSIVAHVDHGKTTLSDSFLSRGKLLNEDRAGQALSLDFDKEEQERGITIKSSGVTLFYDDWEFDQAQAAPLDFESDPDRSSCLYVGNLPFPEKEDESGSYDEELITIFARFGDIVSSAIHAKRGFARLSYSSQAECDMALKAADQKPIAFRLRVLRIERQGASEQHQLEALCKAMGLDAPKYHQQDDGNIALTIESAGVGIVAAPHPTIKEAKIALASKALKQLSNQPTDETPMRGLVVNLIDCPGHVDFNAEVSAALRLTDGAIVVVDAVEGVCIQTEVVLRQALQERVKPILFLNKVDRVIVELQLTPEAAYQRFCQTIEAVNTVIRTYQPSGFDFEVSASDGTVAFGSGLQGWAFNIPSFAKAIVAKKLLSSTPASSTVISSQVEKLSSRLWGDNFLDRANGKWSHEESKDGTLLSRGFCALVLQPIYDMFQLIKLGSREDLLSRLASLPQISISKAELETGGKVLLKSVMKQWLPVADQLLKMAEIHLPCPATAQEYRAPLLYDGPEDDEFCEAMKACDPQGPTIVYVSKMIPSSSKGSKHFFAFSRIFSGRIEDGQKIFVYGPDFVPGNKDDLAEARISGVVLMMASRQKPIDGARAGDIVGLLGLDKYVSKSCTLSSDARAFPLRTMKLSVSPIVRVAVAACNPTETQKLHEALRRLTKSDPLAQFVQDQQTSETILCGAGELHVEVCLNSLRELAGIEIKSSPPVVQFCETVVNQGEVCLAKSSNKHNRIYMQASPISEELSKDIEEGRISMSLDPKLRVARFADHDGWAPERARKVISIAGSCLLVDATFGISIADIRDNVIASFSELVLNGPLSGENIRGVCFELMDAKIHADSVHRRADQICPMTKRACFASFLTASPRYVEPVFAVEVQTPDVCVGSVCKAIKKRRGEILDDTVAEGTPLHSMRANLPVAESFGFSAHLLAETAGRAFPQCSFSHWQTVTADPFDGASFAGSVAREARLRKRMQPAIPPLDYYRDTL